MIRPTADLGEDGELVAWLLDCVATAEDACKADGDNEVYAERHAKLRQIADRLILYREALERVEKLVAVLTNCALRNEAADIISAALSRSEADATRIKDQSHGG